MKMWKTKQTAPKSNGWIVVRNRVGDVFTVRWATPFSAAPELAEWRDSRGNVREWAEWWELE